MDINVLAPVAGRVQALGPPANDEVAKAEHPRAWIVVCRGLGLINLVAKSAEELVERLHKYRACNVDATTPQLSAFDVIDNTDDGAQAVIWFDPALVQAVLNEYKRPVRGRGHFGPLGFPVSEEPGVVAESVDPEVGLVVVESEPDEE